MSSLKFPNKLVVTCHSRISLPGRECQDPNWPQRRRLFLLAGRARGKLMWPHAERVRPGPRFAVSCVAGKGPILRPASTQARRGRIKPSAEKIEAVCVESKPGTRGGGGGYRSWRCKLPELVLMGCMAQRRRPVHRRRASSAILIRKP